jgi:hypothetical protein
MKIQFYKRIQMPETISLSTRVRHKKRRNTRELRIWESLGLTSTMIDAMGTKEHLEHYLDAKAVETGLGMIDIKSLGPTLIPTETLYRIVDSYLYMYGRLVEEGLIKTGNIHKIATIH